MMSLCIKLKLKENYLFFSEAIKLLEKFDDFSCNLTHTVRRLSIDNNPFVALLDEYCERTITMVIESLRAIRLAM